MRPCKRYTQEFISRFVDDEISRADHEKFVRHMADCPACAHTAERFKYISQGFGHHIDDQILNIKLQLPPAPLKPEQGWKIGNKGLGLKLATLGTAAIILAAALVPWPGSKKAEPSAIVNSVDTYGSSVIIIDTLETQHTIIWFSET